MRFTLRGRKLGVLVPVVLLMLAVLTVADPMPGSLIVVDPEGEETTYEFTIERFEPPQSVDYNTQPLGREPQNPKEFTIELISAVRRNDLPTYEALWDPEEFSAIRDTVNSEFAQWGQGLIPTEIKIVAIISTMSFSFVEISIADSATGVEIIKSDVVMTGDAAPFRATNEFSSHPLVAYWDDEDGRVELRP